ncbi:MAG: branched-chain-amino-acid transaminase, partial [Oscillospiraceae bacterium]|nr:branched-chain-amino-acid transaminase [Oscillospiraceae bacterium]
YRTSEDKILLFRPEKNFARMNVSAERSVIPPIDEEFALKALCELIKTDCDWVPRAVGASLYLRPFIIAVDPFLGVRPADKYYFMIIMSPVGAYYPTGLNPVSIAVEENYVRAVKGGMGYVKAGGNYAASLMGQKTAQAAGYEQVLWLDGVERKYIEEVGSMNVFFVTSGKRDCVPCPACGGEIPLACEPDYSDIEIITPELTGSILPGITRMSVMELCAKWGVRVTERKLAADEVVELHKAGRLREIFGTGTAVVISPVGTLKMGEQVLQINDGKIGELSQKLYDTLTGIQYGRLPDESGWTYEVK